MGNSQYRRGHGRHTQGHHRRAWRKKKANDVGHEPDRLHARGDDGDTGKRAQPAGRAKRPYYTSLDAEEGSGGVGSQAIGLRQRPAWPAVAGKTHHCRLSTTPITAAASAERWYTEQHQHSAVDSVSTAATDADDPDTAATAAATTNNAHVLNPTTTAAAVLWPTSSTQRELCCRSSAAE